MIKIEKIEVTPFQQNARILWSPPSTAAVVVDPGGDAAAIEQRLEKLGLVLAQIWLTHSHLDHCGGVQDLLERHAVPLLGHEHEKLFRSRVLEIASMYGLPPSGMRNCPEPTRYVAHGEKLMVGDVEFEARFTPGHSPGHLVFYAADEGLLIAGDTLFEGSIGRTDLPMGNHQQLLDSITREILSLPDDTKVLPGHGDDTTVGRERRSNPFLTGSGYE